MKQSTKSLTTAILSIALLAYTTLTSTVQAAEGKLTSAMGYPYKLLINRANSIKIIYSENSNNIDCKVVFNWNDQKLVSQSMLVSRENFKDEPLASCLTREKAKSMLKVTFQ